MPSENPNHEKQILFFLLILKILIGFAELMFLTTSRRHHLLGLRLGVLGVNESRHVEAQLAGAA